MRVSTLNSLDFSVLIFLEDELGLPINLADNVNFVYDPSTDTPALDYCFFLDAQLSVSRETTRRAVTGRPFKKITQQVDEGELQVNTLIVSKATDYDLEVLAEKVFSRENRLTILLREYNPIRGDMLYNENTFVLRHAARNQYSISARDNNSIQGSISFLTEQVI